MKIVLAGAYGNLGSDILRSLLREGHEVVAADMMERDLGLTGRFSFRKIGERIHMKKAANCERICESPKVIPSMERK